MLTELGDHIRSKDRIEDVFDLIYEALGQETGLHLDKLLSKKLVQARREVAPYSLLDVTLLKQIAAGKPLEKSDRGRLNQIIEDMDNGRVGT